MVFAAGEVLHGRAKSSGRKRPHIDLQAIAAYFGAGFIFAAGERFIHARKGKEGVERRYSIRSCDQEVEITDSFASAAQAAGGRYGIHARRLTQGLNQLACHVLGVTEQIPSASLAILRDGAQYLLFEPGAHPRKITQLLIETEAFQLVDGGDMEMLEDERDALGSQALNLEELERGGR